MATVYESFTPALQQPVDPDAPKKSDKTIPAYQYARALVEQAREGAKPYVSDTKKNWDYFLGKDHRQTPATAQASVLGEWMTQSCRNWLFRIIQQKHDQVLNAPHAVSVEPLDENSTYYERAQIKAVIEDELHRLRWSDLRRDAYLWGSVCGVGIGMISSRPDNLTGLAKIDVNMINPREFYIDPNADCLADAEYVVWEPTLPMTRWREMFPSRAMDIKPDVSSAKPDEVGSTYKPDNTDDNLIYGEGGYASEADKARRIRKARGCFVWIRDERLTEELQETVVQKESPGYQCVSCAATFEASAVDSGQCPMCGGNLESVTIPPKVQSDRVVRRAYPYGRLIVYQADNLLYDGEPEDELEEVFPFFAYSHYRVPGCFYAYGDVSLLKQQQEQADITLNQAIDYIRLGVNSPTIYPVNEPHLAKLGNGPLQWLPARPENCNLIRRLPPEGFNVQAWEAVDRTQWRDMQITSGLLDTSSTAFPSAPISATESAGIQQAISAGIKSHLQRLSTGFDSGLVSMLWQLMKQHYTNPVGTSVQMPTSELKTIEVELQKLPQNVNIRVEAAIDDLERNKNIGQDTIKLVEAGILGDPRMEPFLPMILTAIGHKPHEIKDAIERIHMSRELGQPVAPGMQPAPQEAMNAV